jgi:hypothetical protein
MSLGAFEDNTIEFKWNNTLRGNNMNKMIKINDQISDANLLTRFPGQEILYIE